MGLLNMLKNSVKPETMSYKLIKVLRSVIIILLILIALGYMDTTL